MEISIGIDLGTSFSVAARVNEMGQAEEIVDQARQNAVSIPSVVYYQNDKTVLVGKAALDEMEAYPEKVIRSAKRFINEDFDPVRPSEVPKDETPVTFQAKVLAAIKQYVEEHENEYKIKNAVITVPAYFDGMKINLTRDAAEIAGIDVLGIINEPMAAAIYYCANAEPKNQKFLVYDLGGGTFDVVIIEYRINNDGAIEIATLGQDGNHQLGGDDWDRQLMTFLLNEAGKQDFSIPSKLSDMDPHERQKLWEKANSAKIALGKHTEREITIIVNGTNFQVTVTRDDFERETKTFLDETGERVDKVLKQCELTENDIDLVLLVGGSTYMPMVQNYVRGKFGAEKVKLNNPNLAVAYGAAIYANDLNKFKEIKEAEKKGEHRQGGDITPIPPAPPVIIFNAPRSIGVRSVIGVNDDSFVTNMIYIGEQVKVGEEIEREKTYQSRQDGSFEVPFYSNERSSQLSGAITDFSTIEDYLKNNASALIKVHRNVLSTSDEDAFVSESAADLLTYMASVYFEDDAIKEGDPVKVTIYYSQDRSYAKVEHKGIVKECPLENRNTLTDDEKDKQKRELENKKVERL